MTDEYDKPGPKRAAFRIACALGHPRTIMSRRIQEDRVSIEMRTIELRKTMNPVTDPMGPDDMARVEFILRVYEEENASTKED